MKQPEKSLKPTQSAAAPPSKPLQSLEPASSPVSSGLNAPQPPLKRRVSFRRLGVWTFRLAFLTTTLGAFVGGSVELARAAAQTSPLVFLVALASGAAPFPKAATTTAASGCVDVFLVGASIFSAVVFALTLFKRRFYCRFVCPLGTAVDAATVLRRRLFPRRFRFLRTGFVVKAPRFALFFGALTLGSLAASLLFGVSFGGRSALELDPTALLSRWTLDFPAFGVLGGVFLTAFVAAPLFWRFHICPCGALQDVCFFGLRALFRRRAVAPPGENQPGNQRENNSKNGNRNKTGANFESLARVPISAADAVSSRPTGETAPSRRRFLRTVAVFGLAAATLGAVRRWSARVLAATPFRPPGALPEEAFLSRCARCGRCVAACPTQLLRFDAPPIDETDSTGELDANPADADVNADATAAVSSPPRPAPQLVFDGSAFCEKDCVACGTACPTGAISPLTLDAKNRFKIATVDFKIEHCLIYYQQECAICRRECPFEAIDFVWNEEEYASLPVVDVDKCVGCGRCVAFCPGEPIFTEFADEEIADDAPRPKALVLRRLS